MITGCDHYTCSIHRSCRSVSIFNLIQQRLGSYPTFDQVVAYALTIASYGAAVGCALWVDQAGGGVSLFAVLSVSAAPFLPHPLPSKLQLLLCYPHRAPFNVWISCDHRSDLYSDTLTNTTTPRTVNLATCMYNIVHNIFWTW